MGRPPIGKTAMTGAERVRRWRHLHAADQPVTKVTKLEPAAVARCAALERELAAAQVRIRELNHAMLAQAEAFHEEWKRRTSGKAEKPALPPDEIRDRRIKALTTQVANLKLELRYTRAHSDEAIAKAGGLPRATENAIDMVLHPDQRRNATEADKDETYKLWNAWRSSRRKAQRR